jgi:hypothetical protein
MTEQPNTSDRSPRYGMKPDAMLTVTSLIAIVLLSIHIPDDFVLGFDKNVVNTPYWILIFVVWLCGVLLLRQRMIGRVIILLGGVAAIGMPWIHLHGRGYGDAFINSGAGLRYLWTLAALGTTGSFIIILSVIELVSLRRNRQTPV